MRTGRSLKEVFGDLVQMNRGERLTVEECTAKAVGWRAAEMELKNENRDTHLECAYSAEIYEALARPTPSEPGYVKEVTLETKLEITQTFLEMFDVDVAIHLHYTGHLYFMSPYESDDNCGTCDGGNCCDEPSRCRKMWTVGEEEESFYDLLEAKEAAIRIWKENKEKA